MSTFALNDIGGIVDKSLSDSKNAKVFKDTIDLYMSTNFNGYDQHRTWFYGAYY